MKLRKPHAFVLQRIFLWSLLAIALESIMLWRINKISSGHTEKYLDQKTQHLEKQYKGVLNTFNSTANLIFRETINTQKISVIFAQAYSSDSSQKKEIRNRIYQELLQTFKNIKAANYRQLHFHLPNNESFLRFHKPQIYGDDLTQVRFSIVETNRNKTNISCFEVGKTYHDYRNVFPLFSNKKHIGSVEISFSPYAVAQQLCNEEKIEYSFVLKREAIAKENLNYHNLTYKNCILNSGYVFEEPKNTLESCNATYLNQIKDLTDFDSRKTIQQAMNAQKNFSTYTFVGDSCLVLSFYPVNDFRGNHVGYFFSVENDNVLPHMLYSHKIQIIISVIVLFIVIGILAYAFITKDIINKQRKKLQNLNSSQNHFFSIIAHDLRSPFNAIIGFGELVQEAIDNELQDQSRAFIRQLNEASEKAFILLENLLQWSRSQSGRITLKPADFDISELAKDVLSLNALRAREKQIQLQNEIKEGTFVFADENTIGTVVRNLVSNAIKFTEEGGQVVLYTKQEHDTIIFSVKDSGIGISEEDLLSLFTFNPEREKAGTHAERGTGLGLIVSKDFVERNAGEIWVESKLNSGSVFSFSLPIS